MEFYVITPDLCEQGLIGSTSTLEKANRMQAHALSELSEVERMQNGEPIVLMTVPQCSKCSHYRNFKPSYKDGYGYCGTVEINVKADFGCLEFDPKTS